VQPRQLEAHPAQPRRLLRRPSNADAVEVASHPDVAHDLPRGHGYRFEACGIRADGTQETLGRTFSLPPPPSTKFTAADGEKFLDLIDISGTSKNRLHDGRVLGTGTVDGHARRAHPHATARSGRSREPCPR
jgi:hypothetical protein